MFSDWAIKDRDIGMEKNHLPAVQKMIDILLMDDRRYFSFLDVGCGNGYVVRKISELKQCVISAGMDGAEGMIKKAKKMDPNGNYYCSNIVDWIPKLKFDFDIQQQNILAELRDGLLKINVEKPIVEDSSKDEIITVV